MEVLVLGASGATGKHVVNHLINSGQNAKLIVRAGANIPDSWIKNSDITIIKRTLAEISVDEMVDYLHDCDAAVSCLGHNLSWKGIYGKPRKLVANAVKILADATRKSNHQKKIKIVLMNTAGYRNRDADKTISFAEKIVIVLVRLLLPPHRDNEKAANFLRTEIGQNNPLIEWVVVRPDTLLNNEEVTEYITVPSPTRSAIFNAGKTSRINVGHFMAELLIDNELWNKWKGKMPVIYNKTV